MSIASSVAKSVARSVTQAISAIGDGGGNPFIITPSTETPVAGVDTTWTTNAGDLGTPVSYSWDFGDGTIPVTGATPSHYFVGLGPYTVTCTVTYDDASTDTDTQVITPTAPSASGNLTLAGTVDFTADMDETSTGEFDSVFGVFDLTSRPVGAKLAATSGVGHHGIYVVNFGIEFALGTVSTTGVTSQIGAWYYLIDYPTQTSQLLYFKSALTRYGWALEPDGDLRIAAWNDTDLAYITVPLRTWFWVGLAVGPGATAPSPECKFLYKTLQGSVQNPYTDNLYDYAGDSVLGFGCYNTNGNQSGSGRISHVTLHTLNAIGSATYPADVVQPQDENHIYNVNPDTGSDSNDGITSPIQTITKLNALLDETYGIISLGTAGTEGSGSIFEIDTSTENLDVGIVGVQIRQPYIWLRPKTGETFAELQPYLIVDPSEWTETGGYTGIYEIDITGLDGAIFQNLLFHEQRLSLAALDAGAAGGTFTVASTKLYIKPLGGTDPRSDGKEYRLTRIRPDYGGDTVGLPVVAVAARDARVSGIKTECTAINNNGSYAIGDITGFSSKLLVEDCDCRYGDKHLICFTINATDSTITVRDCVCEQSIQHCWTSYMGTGSGNVHLYENCTSAKPGLAFNDTAGTSNGFCFYSHGGGGGRYTSVTLLNCQFADGSIGNEGAATVFRITDSTVGLVISTGATEIDNCYLSHIPTIGIAAGTSFIIDSFVTPVDVGNSLTKVLDGTVSITNTFFDLRAFVDFGTALWTAGSALNLTFTGNTVRFGVDAYAPSYVFEDMVSADIVECDENTWYIGAADIFAHDFDDGGGAADYTFAQWQALGYDAASTRIDP